MAGVCSPPGLDSTCSSFIPSLLRGKLESVAQVWVTQANHGQSLAHTAPSLPLTSPPPRFSPENIFRHGKFPSQQTWDWGQAQGQQGPVSTGPLHPVSFAPQCLDRVGSSTSPMLALATKKSRVRAADRQSSQRVLAAHGGR